MGAHYGAILVKTDQAGLVMPVLESVVQQRGCKFFVGPPRDGWVRFFPSDSGQDERISAEIADRLQADIFHLFVYHDDIFVYYFYRKGHLLDKYNSDPDYFDPRTSEEKQKLRGRPELFSDLLPSPSNLGKIRTLLDSESSEFTFEQYRMQRFIKLTGLPGVLASYEYLEDGETGGIKDWRQFIHVPDLSAKKATTKAAEAALAQEKRRLKREGLFVAECVPDAAARRRVIINLQFCFDCVDSGLLISWENNNRASRTTRLTSLRPPWKGSPEPTGIELSTGWAGPPIISRNGKRVAIGDGKLRLWDWPNKTLVNIFQFDSSGTIPIGFSADEKSILCEHPAGFFRVSLENMESGPHIKPDLPQAHFKAINSSMSHMALVIGGRHEQLVILDLNTGKIINSLFALGSGGILRAKFSGDRSKLLCATTDGLRVFAWEDLLAAKGKTPSPVFALTPSESSTLASARPDAHSNYMYDVALDEQQNRLLGCGIDGRIRFISLKDRSSGVLLEPIEECSLARMELSRDRKFICCMCVPTFEQKTRRFHRLQVWNYPALCRKAGIK